MSFFVHPLKVATKFLLSTLVLTSTLTLYGVEPIESNDDPIMVDELITSAVEDKKESIKVEEMPKANEAVTTSAAAKEETTVASSEKKADKKGQLDKPEVKKKAEEKKPVSKKSVNQEKADKHHVLKGRDNKRVKQSLGDSHPVMKFLYKYRFMGVPLAIAAAFGISYFWKKSTNPDKGVEDTLKRVSKDHEELILQQTQTINEKIRNSEALNEADNKVLEEFRRLQTSGALRNRSSFGGGMGYGGYDPFDSSSSWSNGMLAGGSLAAMVSMMLMSSARKTLEDLISRVTNPIQWHTHNWATKMTEPQLFTQGVDALNNSPSKTFPLSDLIFDDLEMLKLLAYEEELLNAHNKNLEDPSLQVGLPNLVLYGPPGTGKTEAAKRIGLHNGFLVLFYNGFELIRQSDNFKTLLQYIKYYYGPANYERPVLIIVDECEALMNSSSNQIANFLMSEIGSSSPLFAIIGTTNHFEQFEPRMHERFNSKIKLEIPGPMSRLKTLDHYMVSTAANIYNQDISYENGFIDVDELDGKKFFSREDVSKLDSANEVAAQLGPVSPRELANIARQVVSFYNTKAEVLGEEIDDELVISREVLTKHVANLLKQREEDEQKAKEWQESGKEVLRPDEMRKYQDIQMGDDAFGPKQTRGGRRGGGMRFDDFNEF